MAIFEPGPDCRKRRPTLLETGKHSSRHPERLAAYPMLAGLSQFTTNFKMQNAEAWLKAVLRLFGGVSVLAIFPFVMPQPWMALVHASLGMGELPDKPVVEYLARSTSALCALYGGLLLLLATDVRRYRTVIRYQAGATILLSGVGAYLGLRAGMPGWWMIGDLAACWFWCGAMLFFQHRIGDSKQPK